MNTVVAGVTVVAMKFVIPDTYVGAHTTVAETDVTDAALEALHVIK